MKMSSKCHSQLKTFWVCKLFKANILEAKVYRRFYYPTSVIPVISTCNDSELRIVVGRNKPHDLTPGVFILAAVPGFFYIHLLCVYSVFFYFHSIQNKRGADLGCCLCPCVKVKVCLPVGVALIGGRQRNC